MFVFARYHKVFSVSVTLHGDAQWEESLAIMFVFARFYKVLSVSVTLHRRVSDRVPSPFVFAWICKGSA